MENKNDQEDIIEDLPEVEEGEDDFTDWKALALKNQGIAKRLKTKLEKKAEEKEEVKAEPKVEKEKSVDKQEGFDYAKLAYLESKKIPEEDYEYLSKEVESTGKELKEVLEFDYVKETLKKAKEFRASDNAVPDGTKRSVKTTKDEPAYWIAKGELPPNTPENQELRQQVVNARLKKAISGNPFSDRPVVK